MLAALWGVCRVKLSCGCSHGQTLNPATALKLGVTSLPVTVSGTWISTALCRAAAARARSRAPHPGQQAEVCIPEPGRSLRDGKALMEGMGGALTSPAGFWVPILFGTNQQGPRQCPAGRMPLHGDSTGTTPVNNREMGEQSSTLFLLPHFIAIYFLPLLLFWRALH